MEHDEGRCGHDCPTQEQSLKLIFKWRNDETLKMTLLYNDAALRNGLELYGILFTSILLYSLILTVIGNKSLSQFSIVVPII